MKKDKAASTVLISGLRWTRERRRGTLGDRHHQRSNRQSSIQLFKRALQLVSLSVLRFLKFMDSARTTWRLAWELRKNICCCNFPSQRNLFQDLQARPLPCNWEDVQAVWKKKKKNENTGFAHRQPGLAHPRGGGEDRQLAGAPIRLSSSHATCTSLSRTQCSCVTETIPWASAVGIFLHPDPLSRPPGWEGQSGVGTATCCSQSSRLQACSREDELVHPCSEDLWSPGAGAAWTSRMELGGWGPVCWKAAHRSFEFSARLGATLLNRDRETPKHTDTQLKTSALLAPAPHTRLSFSF